MFLTLAIIHAPCVIFTFASFQNCPGEVGSNVGINLNEIVENHHPCE